MFSSDERLQKEQQSAAGSAAAASRRRRTLSAAEFRAQYQLPSVASWIVAKGYSVIGLQFPDELLHDVVRLVSELEQLLASHGRTFSRAAAMPGPGAPILSGFTRLLVLADNTYGDCCPDEITAEHYAADCIVHFGVPCLSRSTRLPVYYVFQQDEVDAPLCAAQIAAAFSASVKQLASSSTSAKTQHRVQFVVVCTASTVHAQDAIRAEVQRLLPQHSVAIFSSTEARDQAQSHEVLFASLKIGEGHGCSVCVPAADSGDRSTGLPVASEVNASKQWIVNGFEFPCVAPPPSAEENDDVQESNQEVAGTRKVVQKLFFVGSQAAKQLHQLALIAMYNERAGGEGSEATNGVPPLSVFDPTRSGSDAATSSKVTTQSMTSVQLAVQRRIRQRMFNVETLKSATAVGIVVASLSIAGYRETAEKLRSLLIRHHKRAYLIFIGHLNPFKTGNFVDNLDCFVVVACPNSRVAHFTEKSDEFMKPLCSPVEVLLALGLADFSSPAVFNTQFSTVLESKEATKALDAAATDEQQAGGSSSATSGEANHGALVTARPLNLAVKGTSSLSRFNEREYKGLDPKVGQTEVQTSITDGRHGIAKGYETTDPTGASSTSGEPKTFNPEV